MAQSLRMPFKAVWRQEDEIAENSQSTELNVKQQSVANRTARLPSQSWKLGSRDFSLNSAQEETTFCFDNELIAKTCAIQDFEISLQPVNWAQYIHFVIATGYRLPNYIRKTVHDF
ncbi:MAG: hypothetical protein ACK5GQ_13095 [Burkholderiales bacterium]